MVAFPRYNKYNEEDFGIPIFPILIMNHNKIIVGYINDIKAEIPPDILRRMPNFNLVRHYDLVDLKTKYGYISHLLKDKIFKVVIESVRLP